MQTITSSNAKLQTSNRSLQLAVKVDLKSSNNRVHVERVAPVFCFTLSHHSCIFISLRQEVVTVVTTQRQRFDSRHAVKAKNSSD